MKKLDPRGSMFYTPIQPSHFPANNNAAHYLASPIGVNDPQQQMFHQRPPFVAASPSIRPPWAENIPQTMPWAAVQPDPCLVRFTAQMNRVSPQTVTAPMAAASSYSPTPVLVSPDPCSSQTATQWELFHQFSSPTSNATNSSTRFKRRNSSDEDSDDQDLQPPAKITLTEEKVAARFQSLNLDNIHEETVEVESSSDDSNEGSPHFRMSNELRDVLSSDGPVDKFLRDELAKNSMALIPWTPSPLAAIISQATSDPISSSSLHTAESPFSSNGAKDLDYDGPIIEEVFDDDTGDGDDMDM